MRAAIHQPHYFPWTGYFDKMAKADVFVLLDQVQLEKNSLMLKNRVLDKSGEIKYITISGETKGFLDREYRHLLTKDVKVWTTRQLNALRDYYRKAKYSGEIFPLFEDFLKRDDPTICQWTCASIEWVRELLDIKTPLIYQSELDYDRQSKRSDLVYAICRAVGADTYFSGRGASMEYLDQKKFAENGVEIVYQDFQHPVYPQCSSEEFVPGVSVLDMLFNCGVDMSRHIFWENVKKTHEFEKGTGGC
ncbi:WbqC family protein [Oscillospiraceae bacterium 50-60]